MGSLGSYLFAPPADGPYLIALMAFLAGLSLLGLVAWVFVRRGRYAAVRRRARRFRSIALGTAVLGGLYLLARDQQVGFFNLRFWLILILAVFSARLVLWLIDLRRLGHDQVVERQARRRRSYFQRPRSKRPAGRRR